MKGDHGQTNLNMHLMYSNLKAPQSMMCVWGGGGWGGGGGGEVRIVLALHSKANTISEINKPPLLQCSYQIPEAFLLLLKTAFSHDILSVYYSFYSTTSCSMAQHLQHSKKV